MKNKIFIISTALCFIAACVYIFPVFQGLILLPLDLLVSDSGPWHWASTILLKNAYMKDSILQMFPWKHLTFESLTSGVMPLWNPYQFMGVPFMASMKPLVFYPANIFFIFGEPVAWNMLLWLQIFLSMWFAYIFAASVGVVGGYGLLVALAFGLNSLMMGVLQFGSEGHVLLWLPLLLYMIKRSSLRLFPFVISALLFAGHLQYAAYVIGLVIIFALYEKRFKKILIPLGIGFCIAAIQLFPAVELFLSSYRGIADSYQVFSQGLLQPMHLLRLVSPDWFGNPVTHDVVGGYIEMSGYFGIIPLFFAVYAAILYKSNRYIRFFIWAATISLLLSMNGIAQILYFLKIPVITSGYGARIFAVFLFSGAMLSGFGLHAFINVRSRYTFRMLLGFTIIMGIIFLFGKFSQLKMQLIVVPLFVLAGALYLRFKYKLFVVIVLLLTFADLFRVGYRFLTFSNIKYLYPELSVTRFIREQTASSLGRTYGLTEPELDTVFKIYGVETYNPLYPYKTARLMQALEGKEGERLPVNKYYLSTPDRMKYAMDFLGVQFVVVRTGKNPALEYWASPKFEKDITRIYSFEGNDVYINLTAHPRFGLFYDIRDNQPDDGVLKAINQESVDFKKTLMIAQETTQSYSQGTGSATLITTGLNGLSFKIISDKPAVFYLSDTFFPGWHATVNKRSTPILRANYNFRAVEVPEGESEVFFWYLPVSFISGALITMAAMLIQIVTMLIAKPVVKERG